VACDRPLRLRINLRSELYHSKILKTLKTLYGHGAVYKPVLC
jgi:hypothetical protein